MTPGSLVVPLADASSAAEAGGKGASLGFLARAGVAVPDLITPATAVQLIDFLNERPAPAAGWDPSQIPG